MRYYATIGDDVRPPLRPQCKSVRGASNLVSPGLKPGMLPINKRAASAVRVGWYGVDSLMPQSVNA